MDSRELHRNSAGRKLYMHETNEKLVKLFKSCNCSMSEFARVLEIPIPTISCWLNGNSKLREYMYDLIACKIESEKVKGFDCMKNTQKVTLEEVKEAIVNAMSEHIVNTAKECGAWTDWENSETINSELDGFWSGGGEIEEVLLYGEQNQDEDGDPADAWEVLEDDGDDWFALYCEALEKAIDKFKYKLVIKTMHGYDTDTTIWYGKNKKKIVERCYDDCVGFEWMDEEERYTKSGLYNAISLVNYVHKPVLLSDLRSDEIAVMKELIEADDWDYSNLGYYEQKQKHDAFNELNHKAFDTIFNAEMRKNKGFEDVEDNIDLTLTDSGRIEYCLETVMERKHKLVIKDLRSDEIAAIKEYKANISYNHVENE